MGILKNDPGLEYLIRNHFKRIRGSHGLIDEWTKMFGYNKANKLYDRFAE